MKIENNKQAREIVKCLDISRSKIKKCFHPECNLPAINSHILQRKGILDKIATNNHLWTFKKNYFKKKEFEFKRTGLKKSFAFDCFCKDHDNELFKNIENGNIDFTIYKNFLLFTLRVVYDELYKKKLFLGRDECMLHKLTENDDIKRLKKDITDKKLAIIDLELLANKIWTDLKSDSEQFVFKYRIIPKIGLCVSTFFTYDTSEEIEEEEKKTGKELDRYTDIFVNVFPYENESILMMAYEKIDENKVKEYFDDFFIETDIELCQKKLTNLIIFNCENKVFNDEFYENKIKGIEDKYIEATNFMLDENNKNERRFYNINFYNEDFAKKFSELIFEI